MMTKAQDDGRRDGGGLWVVAGDGCRVGPFWMLNRVQHDDAVQPLHPKTAFLHHPKYALILAMNPQCSDLRHPDPRSAAVRNRREPGAGEFVVARDRIWGLLGMPDMRAGIRGDNRDA